MDCSLCVLTPKCQAHDQRLREAAIAHALLHRFDVVGHAPEFHGFVLQIRDHKRGARIAIARLADRTGIQQVGRAFFDRRAWRNDLRRLA